MLLHLLNARRLILQSSLLLVVGLGLLVHVQEHLLLIQRLLTELFLVGGYLNNTALILVLENQ